MKVLDFGMVTALPEEDTALTQPGGIAGTPGYLAPESLDAGIELDGRADLYSLGCVAWWLMTGEPVFPGLSGMGLLFAHARKPAPRLRSAVPDAPEALEAIVADCLAKSPDDRPQTATALLTRLAALPFAQSWTDTRAQAWWRTFLPEFSAHSASFKSASPSAMTVV